MQEIKPKRLYEDRGWKSNLWKWMPMGKDTWREEGQLKVRREGCQEALRSQGSPQLRQSKSLRNPAIHGSIRTWQNEGKLSNLPGWIGEKTKAAGKAHGPPCKGAEKLPVNCEAQSHREKQRHLQGFVEK